MNISPNSLCAHKKTNNIAAVCFSKDCPSYANNGICLSSAKVKKIIFKQQKNNN